MNKKMVRCLFAALALTVAQGLWAQTQPVKMTFVSWLGNPDQLNLLSTFVKEFGEKKGIPLEVTFQNIPFGEYTTKLALQLQSANPPDLGLIIESTAPAFIDAKLLTELTPALAPYDPADFLPKAMELWARGKKTYAVPLSTSPFFVLYNEDLFRAAGVETPIEQLKKGTWTWDSFRSAAAAVKKATGTYGYQGPDGQAYDSRILHNLTPILRSYGGDFWAGNKVFLDSRESIAGVQLFLDMLNKDLSVVPPGNQGDFYTGGAAMTTGQISRLGKLSAVTWKWGIAPLPAGPKGSNPLIGQAGLGAFSKGKNAKLAAELVAYMSSPSCEERLAAYFPPARESVLKSKGFLDSIPALSPELTQLVVVDGIRNGRALPASASFPQLEAEMRPLFDKLWKDGADTSRIMADLAKVCKKYVK